MSAILCPECGKVISTSFPMHNCEPNEAARMAYTMRHIEAVRAKCADGKLHRVRAGLYYWKAPDGSVWSIEQWFHEPGLQGWWQAREDAAVGGAYLDLLPTLSAVKAALGIA